MKRKIQPIFRALVSLILIAALLYIMRGKYAEILLALSRTNASIFMIALGVFLSAITVASLRFLMIIRAHGGIPVNFQEAVSLTFIGYFFNNFLPTSIGGDVVKAYYLSKKTGDRMEAYTSVFIDRVIGLFTMIFMAFAALFLVDAGIIDKGIKQAICAITIVSFISITFMMSKGLAKRLSVFLFFLRPFREKLKEAYNGIHHFRHRKMLILQSVLISVVSQLLFFASIGTLAISIGCRIRPMEALLRMPVISAMSLLPSINGLGLREGSTVLMFGPMIGKENALAVSILWLFVLIIVSVMGGIIYLVSPQFKIRLKDMG